MNLKWPALGLTGTIVLFQGCSLPSFKNGRNVNPEAYSKIRLVWLELKEEIMALAFVIQFKCDKNFKGEMPFIRMNGVRIRLDGFLHQSGPQTTGADFNALGGTLHKSANRAKIRPKDPFCPIISVTDIISH